MITLTKYYPENLNMVNVCNIQKLFQKVFMLEHVRVFAFAESPKDQIKLTIECNFSEN